MRLAELDEQLSDAAREIARNKEALEDRERALQVSTVPPQNNTWWHTSKVCHCAKCFGKHFGESGI